MKAFEYLKTTKKHPLEGAGSLFASWNMFSCSFFNGAFAAWTGDSVVGLQEATVESADQLGGPKEFLLCLERSREFQFFFVCWCFFLYFLSVFVVFKIFF